MTTACPRCGNPRDIRVPRCKPCTVSHYQLELDQALRSNWTVAS